MTGTTLLQNDAKSHPSIDPLTNRFNPGQNYTFNNNGNLTNDAEGRGFDFNGENKQWIVKANGTTKVGEYFYDGEGKRVRKIEYEGSEIKSETVFVNSAWKLVEEYTTEPTPSNPTTKWTATDHLGSPRVITDSNGAVVPRRDFMPFGEELAGNIGNRLGANASPADSFNYGQSDGIRQKFTGYQKDIETDLDVAEARMYENRHGRFTAVDPLLASGKSANPQTFNRFVYVGNRPLVVIDPKGLEWVYDEKKVDGKTITFPHWIAHSEFEKGGFRLWEKMSYTTGDGVDIVLDQDGPTSIEGVGNYFGYSVNGVSQGTGLYDGNASSYQLANAGGPRLRQTGQYDPYDPTGTKSRLRQLIGTTATIASMALCERQKIPRYLIRPIEEKLKQSIAPDAIKAEASFMGLSIAYQQSRDGVASLSGSGGIDPAQLYVAIAAGLKPGASFSVRAEKIMQKGLIDPYRRAQVLEGTSINIVSGGYKTYGSLDMALDTTMVVGVGTGYGFTIPGVSKTGRIGSVCSEW